ncbi:MAG: trimethylamine methyltransferase family protein [Deltaproteobacteria bacterium]|jgi:trimethylamine--corrinoid protein Co-methyltransferase|nr:trimethylamine methyltransferase family protein [Deltaproteobacteria bacterium]
MSNADFIHGKSLDLLAKVGMRVMHPEMLGTLKRKGFSVDGDLVRFQPGPLMELVGLAPGGFVMRARNGKHDLPLNGTEVNYFPGYGCSSITDMNGEQRDATAEDYKTFLRLIEASPLFKINGGIVCQPQDLPPRSIWASMTYMTLTHSEKVIFGMPGERRLIEETMRMSAMANGGDEEFRKAPRVMTLISTLSPLQIDKPNIDSCLVAASLNQPLMISPGPMAGATGPINLEANIVMGNAEILATIAICQLIKPGTPVMYGLMATTADMMTGGISIGSPGFALQAKYCKEMADHYGLPCRCGGSVNDAKELSLQSSYESFLPILTASQSKVDLIVHSNGILNSFGSMSYEKFIVDLEIISMASYFLRDLDFNDQTVDLDLLGRIGPGGLFLNSSDTLRKCRSVPWRPMVSHRGPLPKGRRLSEQLLDNIGRAKEAILADYVLPALDRDAKRGLDRFMLDLGFDQRTIDKIGPGSQA